MIQTGFWRSYAQENRRVTLNDYGVINNVWYLFPQGGGPRGSFATFAALAPNLKNRDLIYLSGVLQEQATAPAGIRDVTILGAANRPRQATSGGVPTGGGASWLAPTTPVALTPLLILREQGWQIENIQFAPVASSACIRLARAETTALNDASHAIIRDCYFVGGGAAGIGIEDVGGCSRVLIEDNRFELLTGTAIKGISTGIAVPLGWVVRRNQFLRNTNAIAMSSSQGLVADNYFNQAANDANNKINLVSVAAQGDLNMVLMNFFSDLAANVTIAKGYKPGTTDVWRNYMVDGTANTVGVPT